MNRPLGGDRAGSVPDPTSALKGPIHNRVQVQRFLQLARHLSSTQLREIQKAYENPTLGHKDIYLRVGEASASTDYTALAREQDLHYRKPNPLIDGSGPSFGPGLVPLSEAMSLIAKWTPRRDLKDFIAVYAPFLRWIPLEDLGFVDDWMVLANPDRHAPIVAQYEAVLNGNVGALALRQSLLPETKTRIMAAICFEAALNPSLRAQLGDELVQLAAFVADEDADMVAKSASAPGGVLAQIRDEELELMQWLGTIDVDQLKQAKKDLGPLALRIGSGTALLLAVKSEVLQNAYILALAAAIVTCVVMVFAFGEFSNGGAWIAGFAWAWLVGAAVILGVNRIVNRLLRRVGRRASTGAFRGGVYASTALISSALVGAPWILLVKVL